MARFDELIAAATQRLRVDPELQLEIGHELRTHLEDSAAEFEAAGYGERDAADEAIERLGDQDELADQQPAGGKRADRVQGHGIDQEKCDDRLLVPGGRIAEEILPQGMGSGIGHVSGGVGAERWGRILRYSRAHA